MKADDGHERNDSCLPFYLAEAGLQTGGRLFLRRYEIFSMPFSSFLHASRFVRCHINYFLNFFVQAIPGRR